MSAHIATTLPRQSLKVSATASSFRALTGAPRKRFIFSKAFWSRGRPAQHVPASSPAIGGPTRASKLEVQQQQAEELRVAREQEKMGDEASDSGRLGGQPSKSVAVEIDGKPRVFDTAFLRDSCMCTQCMDPHSKQKRFQTSDIPDGLEGSYTMVEDTEKGVSIELEWKEDVQGFGPNHRTRHSIKWLRRAMNTEVELRGGVRHDDRVLWDRKKIASDNKWVDYSDYMAHDVTLFHALTHLKHYGLLFIRNVPESEESVVDLASRIGNLKDTLYGRTWDVRSKRKAENIAYTPHFLGLHMDLLYTSNPPHLQLLHSLRAQCPGGESFFSDSFHAAHQLHKWSALHFRTLCTFPVTYHYHHPTHHYHFTRPVLELFPSPKYSEPTNLAIKRVNWSPPFQGPFEARIGSNNQTSLRSFIAASHAYEKLLSSDENLYEYRLNEGECVLFDNRRVLHARKAFDATKGDRWLKGAYVDDDVFFSKLRVLEERYNGIWSAEGVVRDAVE